jgi:hypothetical protein
VIVYISNLLIGAWMVRIYFSDSIWQRISEVRSAQRLRGNVARQRIACLVSGIVVIILTSTLIVSRLG